MPADSLTSSWRDRLNALSNIPPVLRILWQSGPTLVAAGIGLRILAALTPLGVLAVARLIINLVSSGATRPQSPTPYLWWLLAAEFALTAIGSVSGRAIDFCDSLLAERFTRHISLRVMEHAATLDLATFEDPAFHDKLERARVQATDRLAMLSGIGRLIQQTITLVSLAAGVLVFSPWLLLLLTVCFVPAFLGESHFAFLGYALAYRLTPIRRELDYLRLLGSSRESAKELKLFQLGPYLRDRFDALSGQVLDENRRLAQKRVLASSLLSLLGSLGYYAAYTLLVIRTLQGSLSIGDLTFLTGSIAGLSANIQGVFSSFSGIADQALFLTDLLEFFALKPSIRTASAPLPAPRPIRGGFEFRNVSFRYTGTDRWILRNLDFRLDHGEKVALIGENGQGKTTLVKLISRLYDPTEGVILLDGVDLREYDPDDLHREIGVIFQDFMRYEMTARQNIAIGRIEDFANQPNADAARSIERAAAKSRADLVIDKLAGGYDQPLGRRFDGGVDLSGGEWQRIALARAYLRDAQLLILDEPTASLDAISEYDVFCRFAELTAGKMALLISHRFSTVRMVDRIVVLAEGRIAEQGTHEELLRRQGRYAELFHLQAASYQ